MNVYVVWPVSRKNNFMTTVVMCFRRTTIELLCVSSRETPNSAVDTVDIPKKPIIWYHFHCPYANIFLPKLFRQEIDGCAFLEGNKDNLKSVPCLDLIILIDWASVNRLQWTMRREMGTIIRAIRPIYFHIHRCCSYYGYDHPCEDELTWHCSLGL